MREGVSASYARTLRLPPSVCAKHVVSGSMEARLLARPSGEGEPPPHRLWGEGEPPPHLLDASCEGTYCAAMLIALLSGK